MNNLKRTRLAKGITLTEMSIKLEMPISTYAMIESGERSAGKEAAEKISELLCVDPNVIFLPERFTVRDMDNDTSATKETA